NVARHHRHRGGGDRGRLGRPAHAHRADQLALRRHRHPRLLHPVRRGQHRRGHPVHRQSRPLKHAGNRTGHFVRGIDAAADVRRRHLFLFHRQCGDRHRIVPDLQVGLGAGGGPDRPPGRRDHVPARAARLRPLAHPGQPHAAHPKFQDLAMQLLSPLTRDEKAAAREKPAGHHLPYARHVDDHTIETRDGLLMQVIHLRGLLFETADTDEINYRKRLRDAMLQSIGSSRFALYHHIVRRRIDVTLDADHRDDFSRQLDAAWRARLATKRLYVNELFLTLIRRPLQGRVGGFDRLRNLLGRTSASEAAAADAYELRQLDTARDALIAALGNYGPRLLGVYPTPQGPCSEPLEFLSSLYNGEMRPVLLPMQDLGAYLPYRRVSFGQETVELGPAGPAPRSFLGLVSIKDYPGQTAPGMLDELLRLPFELVVSQSFGFVERQAALAKMNLALRRMRSAEDEAVSLRGELSSAKDEVAAGRAAFGEHHMTIALRAG